MSRKCQQCQEPIPVEKRIDSLFCTEKCRKAASRKRNTKNGKKASGKKNVLSGLPAISTVQRQQSDISLPRKKTVPAISSSSLPIVIPVKEAELTYEMMPAIRGYVEDAAQVSFAKLPPPPEPPVIFNEVAPQPIQEQIKHYSVSIPNLEFYRLHDQRQTQFNIVSEQKKRIAQLEEKLKQIKESVNVSALQYLGYGATGGLAGKAMSKSDNEVGGFLFGFVSGLLLGRVIDWATEDNFRIQKAQAIEQQTKLINEARLFLSFYSKKLSDMETALRSQSELLTEQRTKLLNADSILEREIEIEEYEKRKAQSDQHWENYYQQIAEYKARYGSIEDINAVYAQAQEIPQAQVNDSGVVSSLGLNKVVGGALLFKGAWRTFFGAPSRDFKLVIHGPSFSGKSHLTLQFAHYLTIHHGTVLYNTSEEGFSRTMDAKLEKLGARAKGLDIGRYTTIAELKEKIPRTAYNFIILDSVSDMNMDAEDLQELRRYYCCSAIIGVCQNTKAGEIRGGYDLVHDADIKIRVENKIAYTDKNRFIDDQPQLEIFNIPPVPVSSKAEDSVEEIGGGKIIQLPVQTEQPNQLPPADPATKKEEPDNDSDLNDFWATDHFI